jgi:hypothetical protein
MKVYRPVPAATDAPRVDAGSRVPFTELRHIGVVDDSMDPPLIEGIVEHLRARLPHATIDVRIKPAGTAPAPDSLIEQMAREVQVAITGVGM